MHNKRRVESTIGDAMFRDHQCAVLEDRTAELIGASLVRANHKAPLPNIELLFACASSSAPINRVQAQSLDFVPFRMTASGDQRISIEWQPRARSGRHSVGPQTCPSVNSANLRGARIAPR